MGLIKSKSPVSVHAEWSDNSSQDGSLQEYRRPRRRLPPTPSPWTSGELADSSPENQAELMSALRSKWSEVVGHRSVMGQRRSMLRKLMGRLSQKIKPQVDTSKPLQHTQLHGRCDHNTGTAGRVTASIHPVHDAINNHGRPAGCHQHVDPRTTLSIYRSSLQSCVDSTNNNCDKPTQRIYHKSNQV